jgi:antirestriction protein ArdC
VGRIFFGRKILQPSAYNGTRCFPKRKEGRCKAPVFKNLPHQKMIFMYTKANAKDAYQRVTDEVIKLLEKGEIVWQRGWNQTGLPKNVTTGNPYKGWNAFWLNFATVINNYKTPYFLTFKQAEQAGGRIKAGAKGHLITYCDRVKSKKNKVRKDPETGQESSEQTTYYMMKTHWVFNLDQTDGITCPEVEKLYRTDAEKIEACEKIIDEMPQRPEIKHGGDFAYYVPSDDYVQLPPFEQFKTNEGYYSVAFHELAHATGHQSRLNRGELVMSTRFGSPVYSKEELTAEFTAAFLCGFCGIQLAVIENSAAYIKGWLSKLKDDKTFLLKAASQAQRAADFILNNRPEKEQELEAVTESTETV